MRFISSSFGCRVRQFRVGTRSPSRSTSPRSYHDMRAGATLQWLMAVGSGSGVRVKSGADRFRWSRLGAADFQYEGGVSAAGELAGCERLAQAGLGVVE